MENFDPDEKNHALERTKFQLRASGAKRESSNPLGTGIHDRGYLPHVKREGASYFVTFRLADSLPQEVLAKLEQAKAARLQRLHAGKRRGIPVADSEADIARDHHRSIERYLDRGMGACHLRNPEIARLVANALTFFDLQRYVLDDWVVMPNHVHAIVWPMPNHLLGAILKSWKQFTSRRAKRFLGLDETFWQRESFDHWIRDDDEKVRIRRYIRNNPVQAGLCQRAEDWPWSSAYRPTT